MKKEVDAVTKLYDFILYMIPKLEKFPRNQKFLLGDRIETALLDTLEILVEAAYTRQKTIPPKLPPMFEAISFEFHIPKNVHPY